MNCSDTTTASQEFLAPEVQRFSKGQWHTVPDFISQEVSVHVRWQLAGSAEQSNECTLWAWPADLETLALGHLLLDHLHPAAPHFTRYKLTNTTPLMYAADRVTEQKDGTTHINITLMPQAEQLLTATVPQLTAPEVVEYMGAFMGSKGLWDATGCFHRAGIFDAVEKRILFTAEDIGRHNCLDRLAGHAMQNNICLASKYLFISARMTASLFNKARRAGFSAIISRSAVTSASMQLAQHDATTLIGFARHAEERFTLYTDQQKRIAL